MDKNKEVISEIGWNLKKSYTKLPNILFSELNTFLEPRENIITIKIYLSK